MVNIIELIKKEIIVGPGICLKSSQSRGWGIKRPRPLWATYWNPVSERKDGRGKNWRGEREGNGGGEELFSKCTKHRRLYFLQKHGSNKITCGPFLFQSSRMFFIFLTRPPLHSSSLTQSTAQAPFSEAIFYSGILFPVRRPDLLPCVLSIEYSGRESPYSVTPESLLLRVTGITYRGHSARLCATHVSAAVIYLQNTLKRICFFHMKQTKENRGLLPLIQSCVQLRSGKLQVISLFQIKIFGSRKVLYGFFFKLCYYDHCISYFAL